MDIIGGISAATEGLKLVNELRKIDKELDKADLKIRLIELADKLMDAKQALQSAQETEFALRSEVRELTAKLEAKPRLVDDRGQLFETDGEGNRIGEPYCNLCHVREEKLYRMRHHSAAPGIKARYECDNCRTIIPTGPALPLPPYQGPMVV